MQLILVLNCHTRIKYFANRFSALIPIKSLGLIIHGLCFLGVNVFAIECIWWLVWLGSGCKEQNIKHMRVKAKVRKFWWLVWLGSGCKERDIKNIHVKYNICIFGAKRYKGYTRYISGPLFGGLFGSLAWQWMLITRDKEYARCVLHLYIWWLVWFSSGCKERGLKDMLI